MKVNFAICDDSVIDSNYVKELVTKWANDKKYQVNIDVFSSAEEFIFHYVENKEYDVLLLDIEMENMDGVTLARKNIQKFRNFTNKMLDKWRIGWYDNRARVGILCAHCDDAGDCVERR